MEKLLETIISGITWDIIKKLVGKSAVTVSNIASELIGCVNCALDSKVSNEIAAKAQKYYMPNISFEDYNVALQSDAEYSNIVSSNVIYKTGFAKRLDYYIYLTNAYSNNKINLEVIAEHTGLSSVYDLRRYYLEDHDPDFKFIEQVADKLGISKEWLKAEKGEIITPAYNSFEAMGSYDLIKEDNPKSIVFCLSEKSHLGMVCQIDELKYNLCGKIWHFNDNVGSTGKSQIVSIYNFIHRLDEDGMLDKSEVLFFSNDNFDRIFYYTIFPSSVHCLGKAKYPSLSWFDDLINLRLTDAYGEPYSFCQNVVRDSLR